MFLFWIKISDTSLDQLISGTDRKISETDRQISGTNRQIGGSKKGSLKKLRHMWEIC